MDRGLYLAASGMLAEQLRQNQIANDLANASTSGYKAERTTQQSFGDLLLTNSVTGATIGSQSTAVQVTNTVTDWSPQPLKDTGEPLDFAVNGDGFFAVQTPGGVRYTRNGEFAADANGNLVTAAGHAVLGRNNQPARIGADGRVDPRALNVVALTNPEKTGNNLVTGTPGGQAAGSVRSGALEASGADPTESMVDMIESMRAYQAGQKVIQTIDETLGKAASAVGSVSS
jgi:flagellar basal-body rod protein FlgG